MKVALGILHVIFLACTAHSHKFEACWSFIRLTPNAKIAINKGRKTKQRFVQMPSGLKVIACVTCTLWKIVWRGSRIIYSNYHARNMTPSYTSLLGTNFRPQLFYKSAECWNFSYLLVFKSCYEGEMQRKKWTLKGSFVKIQDLRFKLVLWKCHL